jgi:hypothetical protein
MKNNKEERGCQRLAWAVLVGVFLLFLMSGCINRQLKTYFPPTKEVFIEVKNDKGEVIEVRGALKSEENLEEANLGTQGTGTYEFLHFEGIGL